MKLTNERKIRSQWQLFPVIPILTYQRELNYHLKNCESVLDIGCGGGSPLRHIYFKRAVGIDLDQEYIDEAAENRTHHELILSDVKTIKHKFHKKEFDACVALDLIEHLTKKDGLDLIADMERLAKKKVIIFTPNGYMNQKNEKHPLQNHQSGWTAEEMEKRGFKVYGMLGPKVLRKDQHVLRGNKYISGMLSELIQLVYTRNHPYNAAAIFCVKELS